MLKKWIFYGSFFTIVGLMSFNIKPSKTKKQVLFEENISLNYSLPSLKIIDYTPTAIPFTGKYFIGFKEAIGNKESRGQYAKVNTLGYLGKYQFGVKTLKTIGITDSMAFLKNPKLQEKAFVALIKRNKWELKHEIKKYSGKIIGGVEITESGILAAAHLGGAGSVKKFLKSNGKRKIKDQYGTSLKHYLKEFGGFEINGLKANAHAKAI